MQQEKLLIHEEFVCVTEIISLALIIIGNLPELKNSYKIQC